MVSRLRHVQGCRRRLSYQNHFGAANARPWLKDKDLAQSIRSGQSPRRGQAYTNNSATPAERPGWHQPGSRQACRTEGILTSSDIHPRWLGRRASRFRSRTLRWHAQEGFCNHSEEVPGLPRGCAAIALSGRMNGNGANWLDTSKTPLIGNTDLGQRTDV